MRDKALGGVYVDYFNETHGMVRDTMRRFVNVEVVDVNAAQGLVTHPRTSGCPVPS